MHSLPSLMADGRPPWRLQNSHPVRMHFFVGNAFRGLRFAHPRLNPVGILPPGSRPSDAQSTPLRILMPGVCNTPLWAYICGEDLPCAQQPTQPTQPTQRHLARANQTSTTILQINLTNNCREIFSFPARRLVSDTHGFVVA